MSIVSKLEVFGSTACAGEYVLFRFKTMYFDVKTIGTLPFPSYPSDRIHKDSGSINLRVEVNFMLSTRSFMEVQKSLKQSSCLKFYVEVH